MMRLRILCLTFFTALVLAMPAYALNEGGNTDSDTPAPGGQCDMSAWKEKLAEHESSGRCEARNGQFLGKYQLGTDALIDIGYKDRNTRQWIGGMTDQKFLSDCAVQEEAMNKWIVKMHGYIQSATTSNGSLITSYLNTEIKGCKVTWSGMLAARHLCGLGNSGASGFSGKCWVSKYTGLIGYLETNGTADGVDGNNTPLSKYMCNMGGFQTPYDDESFDASQCNKEPAGNGGGGNRRRGWREEGDYGDDWHPSPEIRHYNMIENLVIRIWLGGMALMTNQMVNTMMMQAEIVGSFFDAKHQMETQRLLQQKTARAHKDYHPSEQMCTIGTFARNLMNTDRRAQFSQAALAERGMQRELMRGENLAVETHISDRQSRFETFRKKFCNPKDNMGTLAGVCEGEPDAAMMNRDIDFTRTIDLPLTLAMDPLEPAASDEETAVYALMDNLFQSDPIPAIAKNMTTLEGFQDTYQDLRSVIAMRTVARNSFNNLIAQKSFGPKTEGEEGSNAAFLRALIKDMGITDEAEITRMLGERPSYYAQMELLTKKLYQHPEFIVNLYDKPANVARMRAAMRAIKVMQDRDIHEALMRREMLISMLAELSVRRQQSQISTLVHRLRVED